MNIISVIRVIRGLFIAGLCREDLGEMLGKVEIGKVEIDAWLKSKLVTSKAEIGKTETLKR